MALAPQNLNAINTAAYQYKSEVNFTNFIELVTKDSVKELVTYTDGKATVFQQYADWAVKNPIILNPYLDAWFASFKNEVTDLFPTTTSDSETFLIETIQFGDFTLEQMSRNAPTRHVHFTKSRKTAHALYTGLGATFDYYHTMLPTGPAEWDLKLNVIRASLVAFDLVVCLNRFLTDYNSYNNNPNMQFPGHPMPTNIEGVFRYMRETLFPVIKSKFATTDIIKRMDKMFSMRSGVTALKRNLRKLLMSSHDMFYLLSNSRMLSLFSESGAASLGYELQMTMNKSIANVDLVSFPFVQRYSHNSTDSIANKHLVAHGTWYVWRDPNHAMALDDMRSRYRNVGLFNYRNNDFTTYSYRDFVKACTDFLANGNVNWAEKDRLADASMLDAENSIFRKCGCKNTDENRRNLDWSLYYRPLSKQYYQNLIARGVLPLNAQFDVKSHRHIAHIGEIPEHFLKEEYLLRMVERFRLAIFRGESDSDSFDETYVNQLIATSSLLRPMPLDFVNKYILDSTAKFPESLVYKLFNRRIYLAADIARARLTAVTRVGVDDFNREGRNQLDAACTARVDAAIVNGQLVGAANNFFAGGGVNGLTHFADHGNPFETHDETTTNISRLDYLYMKSYTKTRQVGLALRLFILLGINTDMVDRLSSRDVPIPLGGAMQRHLETQWSSSFWGISDTVLGKRFEQAPTTLVAFDTNVQKFTLGVNYQIAYVLDDGDKWMSYDNAIPGPYIAGKGDGFITEIETSDPAAAVSQHVTEAFINGTSSPLRGYDWNPFMTPYNSTVEDNRTPVDVRGYFTVDLVLGKLAPDNDDFSRTRDRPMYHGVFWNNILFTYKSPSLSINADDIPRFSQIQRLEMQQFNTICQPATYQRVDPVSRKKMVYNGTTQTAYHLMGPQVPERFALETGLTTLTAFDEFA